MTLLVRLAALATVIMGLAYVAVPRRAYHWGPDFLRAGSPSEPSRLDRWLHRVLGIGLVVIGHSHLY